MIAALPTDAEALRELSKMAFENGDERRGYELFWAAEAVASGSPYAPALLELIGERDRLLREVAERAEALKLARETFDYVMAYGEARGIEHLTFMGRVPKTVSALDAILKGGG